MNARHLASTISTKKRSKMNRNTFKITFNEGPPPVRNNKENVFLMRNIINITSHIRFFFHLREDILIQNVPEAGVQI